MSIIVTTGNKKPGAWWASGFRRELKAFFLPCASRVGNPSAVAFAGHAQRDAALADVRPLCVARAVSPGAAELHRWNQRHAVMLLSSTKPTRRMAALQCRHAMRAGTPDPALVAGGAFGSE
jgi:hypothetical protein